MHVYIYKTNILVDFVLNKNGKGRKKKTITREKYPRHVPQSHRLAALMKKRKEEILSSKEQSTVQSTEQSSVHPTKQSVQLTEQYTVQPTEQSTAQSTVQPSAQSNGFYVYNVGILAVLAIGVCVFFAYNIFQAENKEVVNEKQPPKRRQISFRKTYNKISNFDWKKNIEEFLRDGLIIAIRTTGIFFGLKAANIKPPKTSLNAMDIIEFALGICGGVLVKDYASTKIWINE